MVNRHKMGSLKVNQTANKMGTPIKSPPRSPHRKNRQAIQVIHQRIRQGQQAKKKVEIAIWTLLNKALSCYNRVENTHHPCVEEWEGEVHMIKILLVEDDLGLSNSVFDFLDDFADVMQVFDGDEGLYEAESGIYDLILLDLMLPEKDGFQVLKELRDKGVSTPVLIMTAKESLDDKGHGFELGADDYLTKPFYLEELKMRIQALLKRSGKVNENTLSYGNVTVNLSTNSTLVEGKEVELLGKEFDLLVYFLQNQNVILPKTQIFDRLWGFDSDTTISVVEVYVSKIRKKLKGTDFAKNLQTLRSVGYILKDAQ